MHESSTSDPADALRRMLVGETLAQLGEVPPEVLESAYGDACRCVDRGEFDEALDLLVVLVMQDPYDFRFQFGYAICLQQLGSVADAAKHFGLAYMLDVSDAGCAYRLGECHETLGDREAAVESFRTALDLCNLPGSPAGLRQLAEAGLDRMAH